jgi:SAM-dependent methyltransferase
MSSSVQFWESAFQSTDPTARDRSVLDCETYKSTRNRTERTLLDTLTGVEDLDVLEVGCGTGALAVYLAKHGARVTATDLSGSAIERTRERAEANRVTDRVRARRIDALHLRSLGARFDLVVGKFVLHHIEPFDAFVDVVHDVLREGGRAVFMENSSRNPMLAFARNTLVGRLGIPKYGDPEEYPLEPLEVEMIDRRFGRSTQRYPEFICFRLLNTYVFRSRLWAPLQAATKWVDDTVHRLLPGARKYSYHQIIEAVK